jgi:hypothetical protein
MGSPISTPFTFEIEVENVLNPTQLLLTLNA